MQIASLKNKYRHAIYIVLLATLIMPVGKLRAVEASNIYCLTRTDVLPEVSRQYSVHFSLKTAVDRAGWTWRNPDFDGDMTPADYVISPDKSAITKMPELYNKPCTYWQEKAYDCLFAESIFSPATGIAFIQGYRETLFGTSSPEAYAVYGNKVITIPVNKKRRRTYSGDVTPHKLAALSGENEELILFDGNDMKIFPMANIVESNGSPSWMISNDPVSNRAFVNTGYRRDEVMFMYEIIEGPELEKIELDKTLSGPMVILTMRGDTQTWIINRYGVYAETDKGFRRVAHPAPSYHIYGPASVGLTEHGSIAFQFSNNERQKYPFILSKESRTCAVKLSLNDDISIYPNN